MIDIYQFNKEDAHRFAKTVDVRSRVSNGQLEFAICPYCHGGSNRDKKTFAISLDTGQFECKRASCGAKGNMITLARDFNFDLGRDVNAYYNINDYNGRFKRFRDAHRAIESRPYAIEYLSNRGIPEWIVKKYEITTKEGNDRIIVFPFKDEDGNLTYIKYRNPDHVKGQSGSKEWSEKDCKPILFGMNHCEDFSTLVITEGQIDSLSVAAAGIKNAVSVPTGKNGFTWKPHVWNWLVKFDEIVVFGDNEHGEITLAKEISQFFPKRVRIVRSEDYMGHKDANDILINCGADQIRKAIEGAEVRVSFRIKDLADVETVDLERMEFYRTGFNALDKCIGNGFHDGELIVLTGKCGEGKSTFASMLVGRMLQNGLKCFCYSGELPDWMFQAWFDKQITGGYESRREAARKWYRSKCFIYDNSSVIDEKEELFDVMTQAVRDLGCKFILIDNLMTAMEEKPSEDLFRQQSNFVKRLTKFAKGFNVIVVLVAHPRKNSDSSNDSISGSGDITNRANLVLRFQRADDSDSSVLMITKNRTTGKLLTTKENAIKLVYDEKSMRLTEVGEKQSEFFDLSPEQGFEDIDEEDIPF